MDLDKKQKATKFNYAEKFEKATKFINVGLIILVVVLIGYYIYKSQSNSTPKPITSQNPTSILTANSTNKPLIVEISGAVVKPGVYELTSEDRVVDLIKKAEGFTEKVDLEFVEKNINQAQKLTDSQKIYIPKVGDAQKESLQTGVNAGTLQSTSSTANTKVSINTASKQTLVDLPEIGEVTADKIIAARPYSSIDELVQKDILKSSSLEKIRERLTL